MAKFSFHYRIQGNMPYNVAMITNRPTDNQLIQFAEILWYGCDDEGYCVYRRNPMSKEVVRIDFYNPR